LPSLELTMCSAIPAISGTTSVCVKILPRASEDQHFSAKNKLTTPKMYPEDSLSKIANNSSNATKEWSPQEDQQLTFISEIVGKSMPLSRFDSGTNPARMFAVSRKTSSVIWWQLVRRAAIPMGPNTYVAVKEHIEMELYKTAF
jgi:hypothetical protein